MYLCACPSMNPCIGKSRKYFTLGKAVIQSMQEVIAVRILCFGDSNTYGFDPRDFWEARYAAEDRWTDLLEKHMGCQVINAGSNGRTIPRNPNLLMSHSQYTEADMILLMLGTNDLLQDESAGDAAAKMEHFLKSGLPQTGMVSLPPTNPGHALTSFCSHVLWLLPLRVHSPPHVQAGPEIRHSQHVHPLGCERESPMSLYRTTTDVCSVRS